MKKTIIIATTIFITILTVSLVFITTYKGSVKITNDHSYIDIFYMINDKKIEVNKTTSYRPGNYKLIIKKDDYIDKEIDINIKPYKTIVIDTGVLVHKSMELDEAIKPELQNKVDLIYRTPIKNSLATIDFNYASNQFIVRLAPNTSKAQVFNWFKAQNVNLSATDIIWE